MEFKTIQRPYLIQRGTFRDIALEDIVGLDSLISYDYMGSAEFEWGALPKSLNEICNQWEKYAIKSTPITDSKKETMWLICLPDQFDDIMKAVKYFSENQYSGQELRTKEFVGLYDYINPKKERSWNRADFWWDIDNNWMICFGQDHITKLVTAINKVCTKKKIAQQNKIA